MSLCSQRIFPDSDIEIKFELVRAYKVIVWSILDYYGELSYRLMRE